ncbi:non-heme iron oxygenase ferredoxin subunit [Acinetobacter stercoris]|uniref:Naphthalene 1,2-dioxygenase system ferredoxin subunit n=1 Tax=Acinetobacter stercoris TaxID=2126983 RepID=A0A2U3MXK3_9GAMM|nr:MULTISPECIES: non-heme iron oxygenase ferredoxin subunit [Acinetobacter]SPL70160.1 Naphthalene 1,2-dioxygenase system ferredoxin subunit [Acinetobacter stercoris]
MSWISVCDKSEVTEDEPKAFELNGTKIGIFFVEEHYYAIENVCPHAFALLTEGFIEDQSVECPLHEAIFDIPTGELKSGPGCRNLCTYPVRVEGQNIQIDI